MASTEDTKKTLGTIIDDLGVVESDSLDLTAYFTVGAIVVLKMVPIEGGPGVDLAVMWNNDLDYISRMGMIKIASDVVEAGMFVGDSDEDDD